ncbi:MAG: hypothetical protein HYY92_01485 [Parcubacteria group bacterium]|nr:hypothetical protein [Parcubacteria group bacterium]
MRKPYIGITGFMSVGEVLSILDTAEGTIPANANRLVMVGVLASQKTMRGISNKWPNRYPPKDRIDGLFQNHPHALNLIHYNTKEEGTLAEQLHAMTEIGGPNLHGFQLNIAWPSLAVLYEFRRRHPTKVVVLQIGAHALAMVKHSPEWLVKMTAHYEPVADYVLLDPSGGTGKPLDVEEMRGYLRALTARKLAMGLGIAGGLSPATLHNIAPLAREFPDMSIDAEGRLRTEDDHLDLAIAKEYLREASALFTSAAKNR